MQQLITIVSYLSFLSICLTITRLMKWPRKLKSNIQKSLSIIVLVKLIVIVIF